MLKVGMIGAGIISASHLAAVANHPDTCLAAVADLVEQEFPWLSGPVEIHSIGMVIGSHTGPGTVALFFEGDQRQ